MTKRRMLLGMAVGITLAVIAAPLPAWSTPPLVTLCHKGRTTLTLPLPAAIAHIARHGDTRGACCGPCISDADCPDGMTCDTEECLQSCACPECDVCAGFCVKE